MLLETPSQMKLTKNFGTVARVRWIVRATLLAFFVATGLAACSGTDGDRDIPEGFGQQQSEDGEDTQPQAADACVGGDEQVCHITLGRQNGVLSCYVGVQKCSNAGEWSECSDGVVENKVSSGPDF